MSIRIENDQIGSTSLPGARIDQVSSAPNGPGASGGVTKPGQDQVEVSSATEKISAELSAQSTARTAQLQQLSALYASGRYEVDSIQVSQAMVANATGNAGVSL